MEKFYYKKKLGQNFLIDDNIKNSIVDLICPGTNDLILEIGPGNGSITKLFNKFKCKVLCYEIDLETKPYLDKIDGINVIYDDFLNRDFLSDLGSIKYDNLYIVSNLPYYITTPIINKLISSKIKIKKMILMVQKEVGERFVSLPSNRDYGSITVYLNYYFDIKKELLVNRNCFKPVPNVDSVVLSFVEKENKYNVLNEKIFFQLIHDSFVFKRKNIRNNLKNYNLNVVLSVLNKYGFDLQSRAEQLPVDVFVEISNRLSE